MIERNERVERTIDGIARQLEGDWSLGGSHIYVNAETARSMAHAVYAQVVLEHVFDLAALEAHTYDENARRIVDNIALNPCRRGTPEWAGYMEAAEDDARAWVSRSDKGATRDE